MVVDLRPLLIGATVRVGLETLSAGGEEVGASVAVYRDGKPAMDPSRSPIRDAARAFPARATA